MEDLRNDRLSELRKKRYERQKRQKQKNMRLLVVVIAFIVALIAVILLIKGITSAIFNSNKPDATPSPAPLVEVDENGEPLTSFIPAEPTQIAFTMPAASEQNDILQILKDSKSTKKVCYLTFDDGPNNVVTPQILDILRRYNVKATFFQVGSMIEENKDMAARVCEEGHLIGGHSYDHEYSKIYSTAEGFTDEVTKTQDLIKEIAKDKYFPIMRFPGGSFNSGTYGERKQQYKTVLAGLGIYHCDWNALSGDAEGGTKSVDQLVERAKSSSNGVNQVVILMHDAANKKNTVSALPAIIEYFISQGYTFSTLDKLDV